MRGDGGLPGTIASSCSVRGARKAAGHFGGSAGASSAPLDQYIVEHPDYFFGLSPEHAYINPDNWKS